MSHMDLLRMILDDSDMVTEDGRDPLNATEFVNTDENDNDTEA